MSDFDFDVVTGPSQASCPAAPAEPTAEDEARPADRTAAPATANA
ncbi:hypothetical protein [Azospirillum rugosum]|uniref:Uncharacterized protein n=1 Tax=Azospirillum rugosum TaxID=416170 RepID=A0ABS4SM55_9PROT|nr:hypothetical protein [Azospirillum rugosum]MBP2292480.1 hypothetical protein [Azospirillum rugosum]MDQ0526239.1 hypothetical protein [Azospirillum rugosum]